MLRRFEMLRGVGVGLVGNQNYVMNVHRRVCDIGHWMDPSVRLQVL
jgi:hypothetical protein